MILHPTCTGYEAALTSTRVQGIASSAHLANERIVLSTSRGHVVCQSIFISLVKSLPELSRVERSRTHARSLVETL